MVKQKIMNFLKENDDLEEPILDETADAITEPLQTIRIVKRYKEITKTQN